MSVKNSHNYGVDGVRPRYTHVVSLDRQLVIQILRDPNLLPLMPMKPSSQAK
jgi:hypothetical protein